MKVVADIPDDLLRQVRLAVQEGKYESPSEFLAIAITNQLELETQTESSQQEVLTSFESAVRHPDTVSERISESVFGGALSSPFTYRDYSSVRTSDPPELCRVESGPLWGQYNRLLPVKVIVRRLANVLTEQDSGQIPLKSFQNQTSALARDLGFRIQSVDRELSRGRGSKLSSGFPIGPDATKSMERFNNHFVGRSDSKGNLSGAAPVLGFVMITNDETPQIGLTDRGLEFAALANPVLDESITSDHPLSHREIEFYLDHIADTVPEEMDAMAHVAVAIASGVSRPDQLADSVHELNTDWTVNQANTIRTGLVSRMFELGLLEREQVGQRGVRYRLTEPGREFVQRVKPEVK